MSCKQETPDAASCLTCDFEPFVKNNYFTGKMMGASEFIAETHFHQEKMRLHQARLHGWGVVCGLHLLQHTSEECRKRYVRVEPGSAVDCCGHDILVAEEDLLDLLSFKKVAALAKENPARLHTLTVCIRFKECATEHVPVLYDDCGCDDNGCAPNRILESYELDVLVNPPLSTLPRLVADDLAAAVFARTPDGPLGANTPRFGYAPLVGTMLYALDAKQPQKLITYDLATYHAGSIDLGADAFGLAARGDFALVATAPRGGTPAVIQIFKPNSTTAITPVDITATTSTNTVGLASSSDANRAAIVYVRETGALLAYAEDATNGLKSTSTSLGSITAKLNGLIATPDGAGAFAIDSTTNKIKSIALGASSTATDVSALPNTARPSTLAYLEHAGKKWLVAASRTDKTLWVLDTANLTSATGLLATLTLDHPPELVAVGAGGSVFVTEEEAGIAYEQAIDLAPLATAGGSAVLSAPRAIHGNGLRLIGLLKNGTMGVIAAAEQIEIACADLIWHQNCGSCDTPNCVMLGTIEHYQADAAVMDASKEATTGDDVTKKIARIDNRAGRKVLASTQTLQAWLECLQTKGVRGEDGLPGSDGLDGIGLYPDLPKILDIGWRFEETLTLSRFIEHYLQLGDINRDQIIQRIRTGTEVPPLTIYFNKPMRGITRRTLEVTIDAPLAMADAAGVFQTAGVYWPIELKLYGEIIEVPGPVPTPHTNENAELAVTFLPHPRFFVVRNAQGQLQPAWPYLLLFLMIVSDENAQLDLPRVRVALRGDFVYAGQQGEPYSEFAVLDGENIGGKVGEPLPAKRELPIKGGQNPSGNLTQGGLFESWFFLSGRDSRATPLNEGFRDSAFVRGYSPAAFGLAERAPTVNFSSAAEIVAATGLADAVAARIVKERERKPFAGVADFRKRADVPDRDWTRVKDKLLIL